MQACPRKPYPDSFVFGQGSCTTHPRGQLPGLATIEDQVAIGPYMFHQIHAAVDSPGARSVSANMLMPVERRQKGANTSFVLCRKTEFFKNTGQETFSTEESGSSTVQASAPVVARPALRLCAAISQAHPSRTGKKLCRSSVSGLHVI